MLLTWIYCFPNELPRHMILNSFACYSFVFIENTNHLLDHQFNLDSRNEAFALWIYSDKLLVVFILKVHILNSGTVIAKKYTPSSYVYFAMYFVKIPNYSNWKSPRQQFDPNSVNDKDWLMCRIVIIGRTKKPIRIA